MQSPTDYFVQSLPHLNLSDLVHFLNDPNLGGLLGQIIQSQPPETRFVLVDGLNVINNVSFLRSIIDNIRNFYLFEQIYQRCFQNLPRWEFSNFLEGRIEALPRTVKINLIQCLTLTLIPELYGDLHLIVVTGNQEGRNNVIPVGQRLTWIDISGHRIDGRLEVDDLLIAFLIYYLWIQQQREVIIWSRDHYDFMNAIEPRWPEIRQYLNGVLFESSDSWREKWNFIRAQFHNLADFRARS